VGSGGDFAALERMIASVRSMAMLVEDAAPLVASAVESQLRATAGAGQAPDGTPWPPKKDGGRALANAAAAISASAVGAVVVVVLSGPEVFHHFGAQGKPRRQIIPTGVLPQKLGDAVRLGFVKPWRKVKQ